MLTYATLDSFLEMLDSGKEGKVTAVTAEGPLEKVFSYLSRATRFISNHTRREFFPFRETREYSIPHAYVDLSIRRFPTAHLILDQDLLEVVTVNTGTEEVDSEYYYLLENNIYPKSILALRNPKTWDLGYMYSKADEPKILIDGIWGYADKRYPSEYWVNTLQVIPSGGITSNQTAITLASVSTRDELYIKIFQRGNLLKIDDEFIEIVDVNVSTNTLTVIRAARGTTAESHDEDTPIYRWKVPEDIVEVCLQIAKIWRDADIQVGGRAGVSDYSAGVEVSIPSDPLMVLKYYQRTMLHG